MTNQFSVFSTKIEERFRAMSEDELFIVDAGDLFDVYLASFPAGSNPLYRVRTEHDCSCCKNFIRNVGHVVAIGGNGIQTVWDVEGLPHPYNVVAEAMAAHVRALAIKTVFRTKEGKYGAPYTLELRDEETQRWNHFFCDVPRRNKSAMPDQAKGEINAIVQVFRRGLDETTHAALETVVDMISENAIYRGAEFLSSVVAFRDLHAAYREAPDKNLFVWKNIGNTAARFRNTVIGTLVSDLSEGTAIEDAVRMFESKVAPMNYKRPTALITKKMVDDAAAKLTELGLDTAIERRMAQISDVSVNNVLFVDNAVQPQMKGGIAGLLKDSVKPATVDIKNAEDISMDDFLARVVPQASSIEVLVQNRHLSNFMTLTAPVHADAGRLFKWNNGFAWSYDGDAADSIKQRVKRAGGNIDAPLRISLAWHNSDDLDLHAICPDGHIYFHGKKGILDVDMNGIDKQDSVAPVENLSWQSYRDGKYRIYVHQYNLRNRENYGFEIEFFFNGETHVLEYPKIVSQSQEIPVAEFSIERGQIKNLVFGSGLTVGSASQDKWSVKTETLVPVDTLMASPNHWDDQAIGNKHWFFILKGCKNPLPARGIYNEFLKGDLDQHRKVFEVLGAKSKCPVSD